jgi:3-oxoacyl-[acyl-carrier protein] reductase
VLATLLANVVAVAALLCAAAHGSAEIRAGRGNMNGLLEGKKALVTGGSRGIGRKIVLAYARAGASIVTCGRHSSEALMSLSRELKDIGGEHRVLIADVGQADDVDRLVTECRVTLGGLDILLHNAGVNSRVPFAELPPEEWRRVIDTNLGAAYTVTQKALPLLSAAASVVFVGSRVATIGMPGGAHYTASKAGLIGLARSLARELGPRGVRVNVLAPGKIETDAPMPPERRRHFEDSIALRRLGRPSEVAGVAVFLASDLAAYVTGETINVDGGIS